MTSTILQFDTPQRRYQALSQMLSGVTLIQAQNRPVSCSGEFFIDLTASPNDLFCSRWSVQDIADAFLDSGCFEHWKSRGFSRIWVELPPHSDAHRYELNVWTQTGEQSELLMQLVIWLEYIEIERLQATFPAFCVEHLRLQLPHTAFSKPPLPGQDFASSGMLRRIFGLLKNWACQLGAEIITEIPEYFHTACIFSEFFTFIDPEMEALFRAMKRDLLAKNAMLSDVSSAFEKGFVQFEGKQWLWPTEMQAFGLSHDLNDKLHISPDFSGISHFSISHMTAPTAREK